MSEDKLHGPNQEWEPPSPEQQRAFRGVYSTVVKRLAVEGKPIHVKAVERSYVVAKRPYHLGSSPLEEGEEINAKSNPYKWKITDQSGQRRGIWAEVFEEGAVADFDTLGFITVDEDRGTHPADIYILRPNQQIEHRRRTGVTDNGDDDMDDPTWHEVIEDKGTLSVGEMKELQGYLEAVEVN